MLRSMSLFTGIVALICLFATFPANAQFGNTSHRVGTAANGQTGWAIKMSGSNMIVGSPNSLKVQVHNYDGTVWNSTELLPPNLVPGDAFGWSVDINGNTAVVGAPFKNSKQGAAYIFTNSNGAWHLLQVIRGEATGDQFGFAVAVNGNYVAVGAPAHGNNYGKIYLYQLGQSTPLADYTPSTAGQLGWSLAMSDLGTNGNTTLAAGCPADNNNTGKVLFFTVNNSRLSTPVSLTASDGVRGDKFGWSVALCYHYLAVGAPFKNAGGNLEVGEAYAFRRVNEAWSQYISNSLTANVPNSHYGWATAVTILAGTNVATAPEEGNTTYLIGAPGASANQGEVFIFKRDMQYAVTPNQGTWPNTNNFGCAVAASGMNIAIGAYGENNTGAVYTMP